MFFLQFVQIEYQNLDYKNYLVLRQSRNVQLIDYCCRMLEQNKITGLLPVYSKRLNNKIDFFYGEEKELFKLLFMHDRSQGNVEEVNEAVKPFVELLQKKMGLNKEDAYLLHLEMWMYVHGIAVTIATSYLKWDREYISRMLTDGFEGIKSRFAGGKSE